MPLFTKYNFTIHEFAGKDDIRPELEGVLVKPNETIATNSFYLAKVSSIQEQGQPTNFKPFIIKKDKAKEISRLTFETGMKNEEEIKAITGQQIINSEYPKVDFLFREKGKHIKIKLNPNYLKTIANFLADFKKGEKMPDITLSIPCQPDELIRFYATNQQGQEAKIILTPIKEN